jgi:hypothetical protein
LSLIYYISISNTWLYSWSFSGGDEDMSAVMETWVGVDEGGGTVEDVETKEGLRALKGMRPCTEDPLLDLPSRPWPRLVRETAAVYGEAPDPDDELFTLGERCAEAYMKADALQYQAMQLLVEFHRREGWRDTGFSSTAEWLAWRIGIRAGAARERLRTALALDDLPRISEAMERGALSFTKVRALTRVATADNEAELLSYAQAGSAANLERLVRGWKTLDRRSEVTAEQMRHRTRRFSAFVDVDGMVVVRGRLDPEVGAVLMRAVEAATDALFREEDREGQVREAAPPPWSGNGTRSWRRRRRSSGGPMPWGCWPSGRWRRGLGRYRGVRLPKRGPGPDPGQGACSRRKRTPVPPARFRSGPPSAALGRSGIR